MGEMNNVLKGHASKVTNLGFIDQRLLVSSSTDSTIRTWDTILGTPETVFKMPGPVTLMNFNKTVINAICNRNIYVELSSSDNQIKRSIKFPNLSITSFILNENFLIFGTINGTIEVYDLINMNLENI